MPENQSSIPEIPSIMDLQEHYSKELKDLSHFLWQTIGIWRDEVLNFYPQSLTCYKESWLNDLTGLTTDQEWKVDCGQEDRELPDGELKDLFKKIHSLELVKRWPKPPEGSYPSWALNKVGGKKYHEISRIIPLTNALGLNARNQFVDIGGGKGHLSRLMCLYHGYNGLSLDTNAYFQKLGFERLSKYPAPKGAGKLEFINHTFGDPALKDKEEEIFQKTDASIGLHTCGPLALHHMRKMDRNKGFLNFPCCYQKLNHEEETHLSQFTRESDDGILPIGKYALTLASRGHTTISYKDYLLKKKVKLMRAALHFYLEENHDFQDFITVGPAHPRDYERDFAHYAILKLKALGFSSDIHTLNSFYQAQETQRKITQVYRANIIRWRFGRIIEKYLIYDRALAQVEKGFAVEVYQFFDESISPRNIGLILRKSNF